MNNNFLKIHDKFEVEKQAYFEQAKEGLITLSALAWKINQLDKECLQEQIADARTVGDFYLLNQLLVKRAIWCEDKLWEPFVRKCEAKLDIFCNIGFERELYEVYEFVRGNLNDE